jgi:hypothetical protein
MPKQNPMTKAALERALAEVHPRSGSPCKGARRISFPLSLKSLIQLDLRSPVGTATLRKWPTTPARRFGVRCCFARSGLIALAIGGPMSRHRKGTTPIDYAADNALTWMFAGLTAIALVAGLIAQIVS